MKLTTDYVEKLRVKGWTLQMIADKFDVTKNNVWLMTKAGKAYRKTPKYKAYQKAYQKTPKYKAYQKAYRKTPKYKAYHKKIYVSVLKLRELGLIK